MLLSLGSLAANKSNSAEYQMIDSVEINNFRCFEQVKIEGLRTVNLIVGDNGSGKTAFLEALFVAGGMSPENFLRTLAWRGMGATIVFSNDSYGPIWRELFHNFDERKEASVKFTDSEKGERWLGIGYDENIQSAEYSESELRVGYPQGPPIAFRRKEASGEVHVSCPRLTEEGKLKMTLFPQAFPMMFLSPKTIYEPEEISQRYSNLSKKKSEAAVVTSLKHVFPEIKSLSLELHAGHPIIFADIDGLKSTLPVFSVSAGLYKLLWILVAIASSPRGVVLIDEIENGFYSKKLGEMWSSIVQLCRDCGTQIFASTHSLEFLQVVSSQPESIAEDHCLLRMEKHAGNVLARMFTGRELRGAIAHGFEIR